MIEQFECRLCDFIKEYLNEDSPVECLKCGSKWYRLTFLKESGAKINSRWGANHPRYSVSLGVSETQIEEAVKLHPQCEWKRFGHSFRPLIKNRAEKKKLMKQANYEEYDPKDFKGRG